MLHLCVCGGHDSELTPGKRLYVTLFGGCELKRPTIARQLIEHRKAGAIQPRAVFCITVFGGTSISAPTLAEEYLDLQDALRADLFRLEDWDRAIAALGAGNNVRIGSFTLFGGFEGATLPAEDSELERLAVGRQSGRISEDASQHLMLGIGEPGPQRAGAVRQAMAAALMA
jgi:hypothetical protein